MDFKLSGSIIKNKYDNDHKIVYEKVIGKSGRRWYIPTNIPDRARNIHVSAAPSENALGYKGFRGYGGSTIKFKLENGEIAEEQGPWHSNSSSLFSDTGIDVRDKHLSMVIISEEQQYNGINEVLMKNVLFMDDEPVVGEFNRGQKIAQDIADKLGKPVICYTETYGGSSRGAVKPRWINIMNEINKNIK